jgi:hypothetical protein
VWVHYFAEGKVRITSEPYAGIFGQILTGLLSLNVVKRKLQTRYF